MIWLESDCMLLILRRELIYFWYYFSVQLEQIFPYWVLGMVVRSAISVFAKDSIHKLFRSIQGKRLGALGVIPASALGIASPLCYVWHDPHCGLFL